MSIATILDRFPTPPCAVHLGFAIRHADRDAGTVKVAFTARPAFCNPTRHVQGGFLAAMLDDCMGPAVLIATQAAIFPSTIDLHVQFLEPAKPGTLIGHARVVRLGRTVGFVQAELAGEDGQVVTRAQASVKLMPIDRVIP